MASEKEKQLQRQKELSKEKSAEKSASVSSSRCANCGSRLTPGMAFCEECGAPQGGPACSSCGQKVEPGQGLCPHCGQPVTSRCTFCGAEMGTGDAFCQECGNPRGGISCPQCRTLNFRSFCRKCNFPLNPMALYAVEEAKRDPHFVKARTIANDISELEDEIARLEEIITSGETQTGPADSGEAVLQVDESMSDETRRLLDEFNRISDGKDTAVKPEGAPAEPKSATIKPLSAASYGEPALPAEEAPRSSAASRIAEASRKLEELKAAHAAKLTELQSELDAMTPPVDAPPEVKRNFACARKISFLTKHKTKTLVAWVCNKCHVRHNQPSECCFEEFGGKWISEDIYQTVETHGTFNL